MGYFSGRYNLTTVADGRPSGAAIEQWTPDALQGRGADGKPIVFKRKSGLSVSHPDTYIPGPALAQLEITIAQSELADAHSHVKWTDEQIAECQRKKLYWERRITTLTKRLNSLPETRPDVPPEMAERSDAGRQTTTEKVPNNVIDMADRFGAA